VPRIAVVLGAGGTVGHGYHAGVLGALADHGWDAGRADLLVGTSAGSLVSSLLRAGMPASDLANRATGAPLSAAGAGVVRRAALAAPGRRAMPPRQRPSGRASSPARLARAFGAPWAVSPGSLAAALLPAGRIPTEQIGAPFKALFGASWPAQPLWVVAVELDTGRRVVFGRERTDGVSVGDAVRASCAIPAFFEPIEIDGQRYVDGGVHSTTNADLVAEQLPDLVLISAPMSASRGATGLAPDLPMRQFARLSLGREVAGLRARGIPVVTFQPSAADLAVMRGDSLDPAKLAPVCTQVRASTNRRLARPEFTARLDPLFD